MTARLKIALDYDGTITEDIEAWSWFVTMMKDRGHDIRIVTFRSEDELTSDLLNFQHLCENHTTRWKIPIIFTGRIGKHSFCKDLNWDPDIWIDDSPGLIDHDEKPWTKEQYEQWRANLQNRV